MKYFHCCSFSSGIDFHYWGNFRTASSHQSECVLVCKCVREIVNECVREIVNKRVREIVSECVREIVSECVREIVNKRVREIVSECVREIVNKRVREIVSEWMCAWNSEWMSAFLKVMTMYWHMRVCDNVQNFLNMREMVTVMVSVHMFNQPSKFMYKFMIVCTHLKVIASAIDLKIVFL